MFEISDRFEKRQISLQSVWRLVGLRHFEGLEMFPGLILDDQGGLRDLVRVFSQALLRVHHGRMRIKMHPLVH